MNTAQRVRIHAHGAPEVMQLEAQELGPLAAGHVRVRNRAIGVNYIDTYHRSGLYPNPLPHGLGTESAGDAESLGEGVDASWLGARVAFTSPVPCSYATYVDVPVERLVRIPASIDYEVAATAMVKGLTAWYLLCRTWPVKAGDTVLIHAAAGGVGLYLTQWAKHLGLRVLATVGSAQKATLATEAGADAVILYREENFAERVRELTAGKGVALVLDGVGKDTFMGSLQSLQVRGCLATFGNASGPTPEFSPAVLGPMGSLYVTRPSLYHYIADPAELKAGADAFFSLVERGVLKAQIGLRRPLRDVVEVHRLLESRATTGACVLIP